MRNLLKNFLDWLFYRKCYFCGKAIKEGAVCDNCHESLKQKIKPYKSYRNFGNIYVFSAADYKDEIKKLIRAVKYHNQQDLVPYIAELLYIYWKNTPNNDVNFTIIPVPSHEKRLKQRKYCHIELIAFEFSKLTGYKVNTELAQRIKNTKPQYKLSKEERLLNLKDAFNIDKTKYTGENLLILDDICTTGVTIQELIKSCKENGIEKLCGLVVSNP
jgi:ComF family protein